MGQGDSSRGLGLVAGGLTAVVAAMPFAFWGYFAGLVYDEDVLGRDSVLETIVPFGIAYFLAVVGVLLVVLGAIAVWRRR